MAEVALEPAKSAERPVEYLDNAHAVDVLHDGTLHPLLGVMEFHLESRFVRPFQAGGEQTYGDQEGQQGRDGQPPVHSKQVQQRENGGGGSSCDLTQMVGQKRLNLVGIIRDNLFDGPLGGAGKVAGGDTGELFHQLEAQFINDLIGRRMGDR